MWLRTEYDNKGNLIVAHQITDDVLQRTIAHLDVEEIAQIRLSIADDATEIRFTKEPE